MGKKSVPIFPCPSLSGKFSSFFRDYIGSAFLARTPGNAQTLFINKACLRRKKTAECAFFPPIFCINFLLRKKARERTITNTEGAATMYHYQNQTLINEVQRILNQLQQNERNNANTLRSIAGQLQNLAATETQATAMLQQLHSLTNQIALEASRTSGLAYQPSAGYDPARPTVGSNLPTSGTNLSQSASYGSSLQGTSISNQTMGP
jgi:hypothetical protein